MKPGATPPVGCPRCQAPNTAGKRSCFLCGSSLDEAGPIVAARSPAAPRASRRPTFRLSSLMLLIAVIAVLLGIWHEAPGLAVLVGIPVAIALTRTMAEGRARGRPLSAYELVATFLATLTAVVVIAVATVSAFWFTCLATASGLLNSGAAYLGLWIGLGVGIVSGTVVAVVLIRVALHHARESRLAD